MPPPWLVSLGLSFLSVVTAIPVNASPTSGPIPPGALSLMVMAPPAPPRQQTKKDRSSPAILEGVVATGDGFLIKITGAARSPSLQFIDEGPEAPLAILDLPGTIVAPDLQPEDFPKNRYGVISWQVSPANPSPDLTRLILRLAPGGLPWRLLPNQSGVILLPPIGVPLESPSAGPDQPTNAGEVTVTPAAPVAEIPSQPTSPSPTLPPSQSRPTVVIDPGHGGRDPGAVGIGGLQEKRVIFPISLRVAELLEGQGLTVLLTRRQDISLDLQSRVDIANRARATVFVSIHANAINLSRPDVNGIETYYAGASGQRLATTLQASMLAATGMNNRGVKQSRFYVLRRTTMPAALVEVGFVTGAEDAPRLADPAWQEVMAQAIATGILNYLQIGQ